jgi:N-acyl-D-aspartate/D-glutamate deacylase
MHNQSGNPRQHVTGNAPQDTLPAKIVRQSGATMRKLIFFLFFLALSSNNVLAQQYDLVLEGGRVMDPETGLDAQRNVGIRDGKIIRISSEKLSGRRVIHAGGLVVAPGFIDLHQHAQGIESQRVKALDGVTMALELEIGVPDVAEFLKAKQGQSLIHYGTSASHVAARSLAFGTPLPSREILPKSGLATEKPATSDQITQIENRLRAELDAGGLAIGMGIQYTPGATRLEVIDMFRLAAERKVPVYTHVRSSGPVDPGCIEAVSEVIAASAISGAPLHIVHINSTCLRDAPQCLSMIEGARARGLDVTTEAYPYIAGMTFINSAVFNPGWQEKQGGITYSDLVLPNTGEHLTKERFDALHNSSTPQTVLIFSNSQEALDKVIPHQLVMIASDGLEGHPRSAGTFSRVLAQYVREKGTMTLMEALRKMSLMPAEMLERSTPAAHQKGRLQEGADADIVVFDPATIADRATFQKPMEPSVGVHYLLVAGTVIIDDGKIVPDVYPGRALLGRAALQH